MGPAPRARGEVEAGEADEGVERVEQYALTSQDSH